MNIPKYDILYMYSNSKRLNEWSIKIVKNSDNTYTIKTYHGIKNGKMIEHSKKIPKGKAGRTVLEQAILEANSKWNKKHDKDGYRKTLKELESTNSSNVNTKLKKIIRPMLASKFTIESLTKKSRAKNIRLPCYVQRKFDGIRCLCHLRDDKVIMETRAGVLIENFQNMRIELGVILRKMPKRFYLDGELFTTKIKFEYLNGLVRKQENKTSKEELSKIDKIDYKIFDCFDIDNIKLSFKERYNILNTIFKRKFKYLYKAEIFTVKTEEDIRKYHTMFMKEGHEGTILRNIDAPYEIKKRSKNLQKYKDFQDEEFKIIDFTEGKGVEKGLVLWICETKEGNTFTVRPKGTHEERRTLYKNGKKYIGKN